MSVTLNNTIADQFANSYVDQTYADDYWGDHWDTVKADAWNALTDEQKTRLLIRATRVIDTARFTIPVNSYNDYSNLSYDRATGTLRFTYLDREVPRKFYYYQALQFPRTLDRSLTGTLFIPEPVFMAQCEQCAYSLAFDDGVISNRIQGVSRDSTTVGTIKVEQTTYAVGSELAPAALEFLKPYILKVSSRLVRG